MGQKYDYEAWKKKHNIVETPDYNTRDAYLAGLTPDDRGHLPDTFKMPNHITYSDESIYSKQKDAPIPGKWRGDDKSGWIFYASPTNVQNAGGIQNLQEYFSTKEPDSQLVLPDYGFNLQNLVRRNK
jgi:hypothetical protein